MKPRIQISIPRGKINSDDDDDDSTVSKNNNTRPIPSNRSFPINEECTSLEILADAFVLAGFADGTVRIFDMNDAFAKPNPSSDDPQTKCYVDSNHYQTYGAVACQIHAKGVHTSLRLELKLCDEEYCFASVVRGSMECVAIRVKELVLQEPSSQTNILDAITVTRHSDAKLRGLASCAKLPDGRYLLMTGKSIKNIHIWSFTPDTDHWQCLYDTATNGNTIQWITSIGTSVVSKSEGQCVRVWNISSEYSDTASEQRPAKPSFYDITGTESALAVSKDWKLYSTGVFDPGHLKVHDIEKNDVSHIVIPTSGSRRHYASVETVTISAAGVAMVLVSDGSVWCGRNTQMERIATFGTACQVSKNLSVVATNDCIECHVLPWRKSAVIKIPLPLCGSTDNVRGFAPISEISGSNENTIQSKDLRNVSQSTKSEEESVGNNSGKLVDALSASKSASLGRSKQKRQRLKKLYDKSPSVHLEEASVPSSTNNDGTTSETSESITTCMESSVKTKHKMQLKENKSSKKKPRILLKNILNAKPSPQTCALLKTPKHRPKVPVVTETKATTPESTPIIRSEQPIFPQEQPCPAIETPCVRKPCEMALSDTDNNPLPSPAVPRKRHHQHTCTPRKLASQSILSDETQEPSILTLDNEDCQMETTTDEAARTEIPSHSSGTIHIDEPPSTKKTLNRRLKEQPCRVEQSISKRKQQLRTSMCRKQMRLIDRAVRQLPRTEENFLRSRILLAARKVIQDVLLGGCNVASQRAKFEHEILPAFRTNILIPWLMRCELETQKPMGIFDESIFDQALGYLDAIEPVN